MARKKDDSALEIDDTMNEDNHKVDDNTKKDDTVSQVVDKYFKLNHIKYDTAKICGCKNVKLLRMNNIGSGVNFTFSNDGRLYEFYYVQKHDADVLIVNADDTYLVNQLYDRYVVSKAAMFINE